MTPEKEAEHQAKVQADHDLEASLKAHGGPFTGQLFRHYAGGLYLLLGTSIMEDSLVPLVHYRSLIFKKNRTRTLANWHSQVTLHRDGIDKIVPRFRRVADRADNPGDRLDERLRPIPDEAIVLVRYLKVQDRPTAIRLLEGLHQAHRNNASDLALAFTQGLMLLLELQGHLNPEDVLIWKERLMLCPGHYSPEDHDWCAYCGDRCQTTPP